LVPLAAILVLTPGTPLGLLTNAVQTLAVLLPSLAVFLLLLGNDNAELGPGVNSRYLNVCTGTVIAILVVLSPLAREGFGRQTRGNRDEFAARKITILLAARTAAIAEEASTGGAEYQRI
jgi:hypothetical protein